MPSSASTTLLELRELVRSHEIAIGADAEPTLDLKVRLLELELVEARMRLHKVRQARKNRDRNYP